ncbi:MAG: tyrosine-type recombinase/integrase [Dehalococcoidia bacterium]|nr:tyrosine-type recombinase/integrase [Dehalococcoidia bacterium]
MTPQEALDAAIAKNKRQSHSPRTIETYAYQLRAFCEWTHEHGIPSPFDCDEDPPVLTAALDPDTVNAWMVARQLDGRSVAYIVLGLAALGYASRAAGLPDPAQDTEVRKVRRGIVREGADRGQKQAPPLTTELLDDMEGAVSMRDLAMLRLMFEGGLRIGETAALTWGDITQEPDGSGRVRIRRSKADQEGKGAVVAISPRTYELLDLYRTSIQFDARRYVPNERPAHGGLQFADRDEDSVFGASAGTLSRRIRRAGERVGHPALTAHSARVGFAVHLAKQSVPVHVVARLGRWKSVDIVLRYIKGVDAAESLRYFD